MPNKKISDLTSGTSLSGTEELPIVQSSSTVKTTINAIKTFFDTIYTTTSAVATQITTAISGKEDTTNKSTNVNTDQASNTKYPSVKAVYDWATGLFVKKGTLTTNTIPKATSSDTIGDSSITDNGTQVTVNNGFYVNSGGAEVAAQGNTAFISADQQSNTNIESNLTENRLLHNIQNTFDAPISNFPHLTASQIVATDASKNLVSIAFGTTAGTVLEGNRITQTITNGVTDKSPSEDAIFDALALKADKTDLVASKIFMYRNFK